MEYAAPYGSPKTLPFFRRCELPPLSLSSSRPSFHFRCGVVSLFFLIFFNTTKLAGETLLSTFVIKVPNSSCDSDGAINLKRIINGNFSKTSGRLLSPREGSRKGTKITCIFLFRPGNFLNIFVKCERGVSSCESDKGVPSEI